MREPYMYVPVYGHPAKWLQRAPNQRPLPPLSHRDAYLHVAGLLAVALGWDTIDGVLRFLRLAGVVDLAMPPVNSAAPGIMAAGAWLIVLSWRHGQDWLTWAAGGTVVLGAVLLPRNDAAAETAGVLLLAAVIVWLCLAVGWDFGVPYWRMGICPPWAPSRGGRRQAVAVCLLSLAGMVVVTSAGTLLRLLPGPQAGGDQAAALGITTPLHLYATALTAGIREELPLVAMVVLLLGAAGRPAWEMYTLAAVARVLPHGYLGVPAVATLLISVIGVWLYRRTGRLTPIVAAHTLYNLLAVSSGTHFWRFALPLFAVGLLFVPWQELVEEEV